MNRYVNTGYVRKLHLLSYLFICRQVVDGMAVDNNDKLIIVGTKTGFSCFSSNTFGLALMSASMYNTLVEYNIPLLIFSHFLRRDILHDRQENYLSCYVLSHLIIPCH